MLNLDTSTEFGARVAHRLRDEHIVWLTTVCRDQTPQPSPVWFLWDGTTFLVYSQPDTPKLRSIERNPKVALNFNGDGTGGDIIVFSGEVANATAEPPADEVSAYVEKYRDAISRIEMSPEGFAQEYSVAIRVTPTGLRGH